MSPELQAAIDDFRTHVEQIKAGISEWKAKESTKIDLLANRFEKMDLLGSGETPAFDDERTGRPAYGLPFANSRPATGRLSQDAKRDWEKYLSFGDQSGLRASMSVDNDPKGGFLVAPVVEGKIRALQFDTSPIRQLALLKQIDEGDGWITHLISLIASLFSSPPPTRRVA